MRGEKTPLTCRTKISPATSSRISVSDNGSGMSPEIIARVFEPFFTTKGIGKGSGLGLAQIYGFAKESGGGVRISSEVGVGTKVMLFLPRSDRAMLTSNPPTSVGSTRLRDVDPRKPAATVLLVEDDETVAALAAESLDQLGYKVARVPDAVAALAELANGRCIDLVFSDIMMPGGMSGADLAREIIRRRPNLPVVLTDRVRWTIGPDCGRARSCRSCASRTA